MKAKFCLNYTEGIQMKRTSSIPYEEITLLSLTSIAPETKFQLYGRIKELGNDYIVINDNNLEHKFSVGDLVIPKIEAGNIILIFGQKNDSGVKLEKILKMSFDWDHLKRIRALEEK
jgi:hypothetical protein